MLLLHILSMSYQFSLFCQICLADCGQCHVPLPNRLLWPRGALCQTDAPGEISAHATQTGWWGNYNYIYHKWKLQYPCIEHSFQSRGHKYLIDTWFLWLLQHFVLLFFFIYKIKTVLITQLVCTLYLNSKRTLSHPILSDLAILCCSQQNMYTIISM